MLVVNKVHKKYGTAPYIVTHNHSYISIYIVAVDISANQDFGYLFRDGYV